MAEKKKIAKGITVAIVWSAVYFIWLFFFFRANWNFDPSRTVHWLYLRFQWLHGWVISTPREWVFIIALCFAIPLWIFGFILFYAVPYKAFFLAVALSIKRFLSGEFLFPDKEKDKKQQATLKEVEQTQPQQTSGKRRSHRDIRPPSIRQSTSDFSKAEEGAGDASADIPVPGSALTATAGGALAGAGLSSGSSAFAGSGMPQTTTTSGGGSFSRTPSSSRTSKPILETPEEASIKETLERAKYEVLEKIKIGQNMFSYVGLGPQSVMICLVDDSKGDWLADEEMFGSEPPLWFSESSHKTSPAYVVLRTAEHLKSVYNTMPETRHIDVYAFLIFCEGKIINADDMMETWRNQSVSICRARNGQPATLPELEPILPENDKGGLNAELRTKLVEGFDKMTVKI